MKRVALVIIAVLLLGFAYYAISPLFRNIKVNEPLPVGTDEEERVKKQTKKEAEVIGTTGHPASGAVRILESNGKKYVRYENFKTINGPDLYVYLSKDLDAKEYVSLGEVKATEGNVNYEIPSGVNLDEYNYVLTWCEAFSVLFNYADISSISKNSSSSERVSISLSQNTTGLPLKLPAGWGISIFAENLPGARVIKFDPAGYMLVSLMSAGKVMVLKDANGDGEAEDSVTLLQGLDQPHGLAFYCLSENVCRLYVAERSRVTMYDYDIAKTNISRPQKILDLPYGKGHDTRTLLIASIGGKEKLLVHIGSSCNVCRESDTRRATILSADLDGSDMKVFASGLRNSVFFVKHPVTGQIWATDNGRDYLGDDLPPDEINLVEEGKNYGWPLCYGKNIHDTQFDKNSRNPCVEPDKTPGFIGIPAHSAPLGLAFVSDSFFVAYHGSWNRSVPAGYKVVRHLLDSEGLPVDQAEDFITGWLTDKGEVLGRPVDIVVHTDGAIYISDDKRGVIYRVISL